MKLLVHDLPAPRAKQIFGNLADIRVFSPEQPIHPCRGCFGCWVKTPGACVLHDAYQQMGRLLAQCSAWIHFSRCGYGGFCPFVNNGLDRCIP